MTINSDSLINQTLLNTLSTITKEVPAITNFDVELQRQLIDNLQSQKNDQTVQTDAAVEEFKRELSSIGALNFLQQHNFEKIGESIENKRDELMESLGLNNTSAPLTQDERKSALETLESMLNDYTKSLLQKAESVDKLIQSNTLLGTFLKQI